MRSLCANYCRYPSDIAATMVAFKNMVKQNHSSEFDSDEVWGSDWGFWHLFCRAFFLNIYPFHHSTVFFIRGSKTLWLWRTKSYQDLGNLLQVPLSSLFTRDYFQKALIAQRTIIAFTKLVYWGNLRIGREWFGSINQTILRLPSPAWSSTWSLSR
jgi:hypothetical protein